LRDLLRQTHLSYQRERLIPCNDQRCFPVPANWYASADTKVLDSILEENLTDEEKVDAIAAAATTAQKEQTAKLKLWNLYDAIAKAPNADAKAKAQKVFATAKVKALKVMQEAVKKAAMTK